MKTNRFILIALLIILVLSISSQSAELQTDTKDKFGAVKTEDANNIIEIELDITGLNPTKEYAVIDIKNIGKKLSGGLNDIMVISPIPLFNINIESDKYKTKTVVTNQSYTCSGSSYGYIDTTHFYCNKTYLQINNATLLNEPYDIQYIIKVPADSKQKDNIVTWSTSEIITAKETEVKTLKLKSKSISSSYGYGIFMYYIEAEEFLTGMQDSYTIKVTPFDFGLLPIKYTVCIGDNKNVGTAFCLDPTITSSRTWTTNADFTNGTILNNMTTSNDDLRLIGSSTTPPVPVKTSDVSSCKFVLDFDNTNANNCTSGATATLGSANGYTTNVTNTSLGSHAITFNDASESTITLGNMGGGIYNTPIWYHLWFQYNDALVGGTEGYLYSDWSGASCGDRNIIGAISGQSIVFSVCGSQGSITTNSTLVSDTNWHMIDYVWNSTTAMDLYYDGKVINSSTQTWTFWTGGNRVLSYSGANQPFDGKMDNFMWASGLSTIPTAQQISNLYYVQSIGKTQSQLQDRQSWTPQSGNTFTNISAVVVTTPTSTVKFRYNSTNASLDTSAYTTLSTNGTNDLTFNLNANDPIFYEFMLQDSSGSVTPKITSYTINEALLITNTCTYSSGNWTIQSADNCNITTTNNMAGNKLTFNGTGHTRITGNVTSCGELTMKGGAEVTISGGGRLC